MAVVVRIIFQGSVADPSAVGLEGVQMSVLAVAVVGHHHPAVLSGHDGGVRGIGHVEDEGRAVVGVDDCRAGEDVVLAAAHDHVCQGAYMRVRVGPDVPGRAAVPLPGGARSVLATEGEAVDDGDLRFRVPWCVTPTAGGDIDEFILHNNGVAIPEIDVSVPVISIDAPGLARPAVGQGVAGKRPLSAGRTAGA